jgi:hypothetical protein
MLHAVATSAATFAAVNVQHVELADQISKDDCAIAGHMNPRALPASRQLSLAWKGIDMDHNEDRK